MRSGDRATGAYPRNGINGMFDVIGTVVLTSNHKDIFFSTGDVEFVCKEKTNISGIEPAIDEWGREIVEVAIGQRWTYQCERLRSSLILLYVEGDRNLAITGEISGGEGKRNANSTSFTSNSS